MSTEQHTQPSREESRKYSESIWSSPKEGDTCPNCGCQLVDPLSSSNTSHDIALCQRLSPPPETGVVDEFKKATLCLALELSAQAFYSYQKIAFETVTALTAHIAQLEQENERLNKKWAIIKTVWNENDQTAQCAQLLDRAKAAEARVKELEAKLKLDQTPSNSK